MEFKMNALAYGLHIDIEEIIDLDEITVQAEGIEYLVLDEDEREEKVTEKISESLWAFNPSFLAGETGLDIVIFEALAEKYEDANEAVLSLIEKTCGLEEFVNAAVSADGYGHFLASYDGHELELRDDYYAYRID